MTKFVDGIDINSCEYVLVNHNGKQFQKLAELLSVLVFEAFGQYIHPTRYRQIIRSKKLISDDQKHGYNVACVQTQSMELIASEDWSSSLLDVICIRASSRCSWETLHVFGTLSLECCLSSNMHDMVIVNVKSVFVRELNNNENSKKICANLPSSKYLH